MARRRPRLATFWEAQSLPAPLQFSTLLTQSNRFGGIKMLPIELKRTVLHSHTAPSATVHTSLKMSLSVVQLVAVPHELPVIG